jgi:serine/threonine protein kinase
MCPYRNESEDCVLLKSGDIDSAFVYVDKLRNRVIKRASYSLKSEYVILEGINHPNIVRYYNYKERTFWSEIEMEYCPRKSLSCILYSVKSVQEALTLFKQIVIAVQFIHERDIAHLDIKPENVLIDASGTLKLADFGLAQKLTSPSSITKFTGTANYACPELFYEQATDGKKADMFSLGVLFLELLYHVHPFASVHLGDEVYSLLVFNSNEFWTHLGSVSHRTVEIPGGVRDMVERLLSPFPAHRLSADELLVRVQEEKSLSQ